MTRYEQLEVTHDVIFHSDIARTLAKFGAIGIDQ